MSVTMAEVARRAGVGIGTVSRVINNSAQVREETRQRVLDAINDLGYRQTRVARALSHQGEYAPTVGILSPLFTLPSYQLLLRGAHGAATISGYHLLLTSPPPGADLRLALERAIRQFHVDGMFIVASLGPATPSIRELVGPVMPVVAVDRQLPDVTSVCGDSSRGGQLAAEYLWRRGCRRPAVLSLPKHPRRRESFVQYFRERGDDQIDQRVCPISDFSEREGYELTGQLLARNPDGFFFCSDMLAIGGLARLREAGVNLPAVGYDNLDFAGPLGLTTIDHRYEAMGRIAFEMLVQQIEGHRKIETDQPERRIIAPELVVRST